MKIRNIISPNINELFILAQAYYTSVKIYDILYIGHMPIVYTTNHDDNIWYLFNIWDENIFVQWRLVVFRFYAYKFKVQFFVMSWKDEVIIPLIRMMTYNIYKTLSPKFLAHAVSLYPFVKNSIIFYSILDVSKISRSQWFRIKS